MPFGIYHDVVRGISRSALWSFFTDIKLQNTHNVPSNDQPVIIAGTHHNMIVDAAIVSVTFPQRIHYWAKDSMFKHPYARAFLNNCGVVPVDRTTKNNAELYAKTLDVLELGETIAVFPEGTSHTLPGLGRFRDGVSFAALEYAKRNQEKNLQRPIPVLPIGIVYTQKSKYRSSVIVKYGQPVQVEEFLPLYLEDPKAAAKQLTKKIETSIREVTVNAPNWEVRYAADMARSLLFPGETDMTDYVEVTQSLIDAFTTLEKEEIQTLQQKLVEYRKGLQELSLTDSQLSKHQSTMNANSTSLRFLKSLSLSLLVLAVVLPCLIVHLPLYMAGHLADRHEIFEEVRAQHKIFLGLVSLPFLYLIVLWWLWCRVGFWMAVATLAVFGWYHVTSIDRAYRHLKETVGQARLVDAFVLGRGMWGRRERVLALIRLREENLNRVRAMVTTYRASHDDVHQVWSALRQRVRKFGQVSKLRYRKKALVKQYEWCFEG